MKNEKIKELKHSKIVPGVVYWKNQEPISIKMNNSELLKTYRKAWDSTIVNLKVWKKDLEVIFHSIQRFPVSWDFQHIDFYAITRWEKLNTKITLNFIWDSEAKKEWWIIEELTRELEIQCLPKDLVESFDVDLSLLKKIWDSIKVSDLNIDTKKYSILTNIWDIVVMASEPAKMENLDTPITEEAVTWSEEEASEDENFEDKK
jgi:large subunit ribosomal protein L25